MKNSLRIIFVLVFTLSHQVFAHTGKPKYHIIIDTDGGLDDMRAISMFLAANDVRVLGISCSQGTLTPVQSYKNVKALLHSYHHEGIPVGKGEPLDFLPPEWSALPQSISWGTEQPYTDSGNVNIAAKMLRNILSKYAYKQTWVALGSLDTYVKLLQQAPELAKKIERIVWYCNVPLEQGFNNSISPESFNEIRAFGVPIEIVSKQQDRFYVGKEYRNALQEGASVYAKQIMGVLEKVKKAPPSLQHPLGLYDDFVPLYIIAPLLFDIEEKGSISYVKPNASIPEHVFYKTISNVLESSLQTNNRVFIGFPIDSILYKPEYKSLLKPAIDKYGKIEWKAICMTNEIHGHTGIYSLIGAKMGIRAMEYFNVGVNNLQVHTYSGNKPPLSCFNDGIQISTGSTIGQGLITIDNDIRAVPTATFEFNHQKVQISLKPEIAHQIRSDIKFGVETYGLLSEQYWAYIEKLAISYWLNIARNDVFVCNPL